MYEDDTTYVESGLAGNTEDDEDPALDTGLDREVPTTEANVNYVMASVMLPRRYIHARGKFIGRKKDADGNVVGRSNDRPIIDTWNYNVELGDGVVSELSENVISESIHAECDDSGNDYLMMDSIMDYWKSDKALSVASHNLVQRGQIFMWRSIVGWQLCVQWRDGFTS